jgi:hypothetical protein
VAVVLREIGGVKTDDLVIDERREPIALVRRRSPLARRADRAGEWGAADGESRRPVLRSSRVDATSLAVAAPRAIHDAGNHACGDTGPIAYAQTARAPDPGRVSRLLLERE